MVSQLWKGITRRYPRPLSVSVHMVPRLQTMSLWSCLMEQMVLEHLLWKSSWSIYKIPSRSPSTTKKEFSITCVEQTLSRQVTVNSISAVHGLCISYMVGLLELITDYIGLLFVYMSSCFEEAHKLINLVKKRWIKRLITVDWNRKSQFRQTRFTFTACTELFQMIRETNRYLNTQWPSG